MSAAELHENMPADVYHADPAPEPSLSAGIAKILLSRTERAAWLAHPRLNPHYEEPERDKFDLGTSAHAMLLENDESRIVVVKADNWRTNAAKAARDEAHDAGKTALLERDFAAAREMVEAARTFIATSEIAADWQAAKSEQTIVWSEDGVWCRARPDRLTNDRKIILDYKTTSDASPSVFTSQIVRMGYHVQEAFYRRAVRAMGHPDPAFVFLAQECVAPYECALYASDPTLREIAEALVERAIEMWRHCMKTKEWRGHGGRVHWANAPTWLRLEHEERLLGVGA